MIIFSTYEMFYKSTGNKGNKMNTRNMSLMDKDMIRGNEIIGDGYEVTIPDTSCLALNCLGFPVTHCVFFGKLFNLSVP